ncbi:hypothetical protein Q1W73_08550 [Asticcacaulis sp. ZE23SCel15]|uniref:hypothetical protein n=1 Tax=Asticcacaulis sp. ZE23SCel15 TaxID=3059027 RepID=UPI00265F18AE|nr:hypothetical protein [Asticcacaulis sp. ZE23SCel15]WKL55758.1 hypothetical protein Q1W73_08550 [Asticcacaulis sp. ZE23SCel15]
MAASHSSIQVQLPMIQIKGAVRDTISALNNPFTKALLLVLSTLIFVAIALFILNIRHEKENHPFTAIFSYIAGYAIILFSVEIKQNKSLVYFYTFFSFILMGAFFYFIKHP